MAPIKRPGPQPKCDGCQKSRAKGGAHVCTLVRDLRKPTLGHKYSQFWDAFGLTGSLQIPRQIEPVLVMFGTMGSHLTANPALGSEDAGLTGAQAEAMQMTLAHFNTVFILFGSGSFVYFLRRHLRFIREASIGHWCFGTVRST